MVARKFCKQNVLGSCFTDLVTSSRFRITWNSRLLDPHSTPDTHDAGHVFQHPKKCFAYFLEMQAGVGHKISSCVADDFPTRIRLPTKAKQLAFSFTHFVRCRRESNPRMAVLQTAALGLFATASFFLNHLLGFKSFYILTYILTRL